jgi:hypothetical protein
MLKRTRVILTWQRLVGLASGTFGAALTVATAAQVSMANSLGAVNRPPEFIASICGCLFLFLAFPLYTGREWARRALLLTTYCILAALAIFLLVAVLQQSWLSPASVHPGLRFVMGVCALVSFLTPPAFLLAALHHADVRRAFQAKDASNQSMQPTASRRTASLSDD